MLTKTFGKLSKNLRENGPDNFNKLWKFFPAGIHSENFGVKSPGCYITKKYNFTPVNLFNVRIRKWCPKCTCKERYR